MTHDTHVITTEGKMTHSEKRAEWWKEGIIGLGVGVLYGTTSVLVGHPFDTVKTKMQAQVGFEKTNMFQSFTKTVREQGIKGLYRGCLPPIFGSGIYRSAQFAAFEGMYTFLGDNYSSTRYENQQRGLFETPRYFRNYSAPSANSTLNCPKLICNLANSQKPCK